MSATKRCSGCSKREGKATHKPVSEFNRNFSSPDGLQSTCKPCQYEQQKARRAVNSANNKAKLQGSPAPAPAPAPVSLHSPADFEITVEEPAPVEAPPVERAHTESARERAQRHLKEEHKALLDENTRLKSEQEAYLKLGRPEVLVYGKAKQDRSDSTACAILSDWHVEEPVERNAVHGLNEYNPEIARDRAAHCFRNLLALTDMMGRDTTIKTLHLSMLGDFFSGWIHEELIAGNSLAPGDAAHFCEGLLASGMDFLLKESKYQIEVDAIPGNHGRMTRQMHFGDPAGTSLETFMYRSLANRYANNPRVDFRVSGQAMVYRPFYERFKMRLIHGYEVKYGGGVGGITIPLNKALAQWDNPIRADLTVLGHFHQFFDGRRFLVNGSLIGYNLFAQAIKASFEEAQQAFFLVHARNGGQRSITAPIWLDDAHKLRGVAL